MNRRSGVPAAIIDSRRGRRSVRHQLIGVLKFSYFNFYREADIH